MANNSDATAFREVQRFSKAYSVSGNQGVELEFNDGRRLMIGAQRAPALAEAIHLKKQTYNKHSKEN